MKSKVCRATAALVSVMVTSTLLSSTNVQNAKAATKVKASNKVEEAKKELLKEAAAKRKASQTKTKLAEKFGQTKTSKGFEEEKNQEEVVRVIVELKAKSAAEKAGLATEATKEQIKDTLDDQSSVISKVKKELNISNEDIKNRFGNVVNGFSLNVKRKDIEKIKRIAGVKKVTEANTYHPTMSTAKDLTQVKQVWQNKKYKGQGLVAAIIDTGIDYDHKDMRSPSDKSKLKLTKESIAEIKASDSKDKGQYYTDKVPYGYNFADKTNEVKDLGEGASMHGMHVAGIVAADGTEEEVNKGEAIQGVAPEAQLLAMKVFTNDPNFSSAYSDDIVAAIEKSVEFKADVINMSLGADCGFVDSSDPEQVAIKKAADAGVVCVVSAGNSDTSTTGISLSTQKDNGTVGDPGLAEDAIEVASSENTAVTMNAFTATADGQSFDVGFSQCTHDPRDTFKKNQKIEVVECGKGSVDDFKGKDVKGKVALVQRGVLDFVNKQKNAQSAGASAVIVYNNDNDESYINMATESSVKIPALFVRYSDGLKLKNAKKAEVEFNGATIKNANQASQQMSDFTSWGPTPDLEFAPEVTAPGGNIYSTVNNNRYESMSGTSMAAPHTTGVTALVLQAAKEKNLGLSGRELVKFTKNSLINTAKVLYDQENTDGNVPYSPRRQGAGLIQAEDAIDNTVIAVGDEGDAAISLKEVGNSTKFDITLKNYGDKDETYTLKTPGGVLTAKTNDEVEQYSQDTELKDSKVTFDKNKVTVPAKGETKVTATLSIGDKAEKENYAEGFIQFVNQNSKEPSLTVPYMGYYGDWSKERVVAPMTWEEESQSYLIPSTVASDIEGGYYELNTEDPENNIAISPNGDGYFDNLAPALRVNRNAKSIKVDLLDKDKNIVAKDIKGIAGVRKAKLSSSTNASLYDELIWDGTSYNKSTGKDEVVPDGKYYYKLKSKIDFENAKEQEDIIPVTIDTVAPKVTLNSSKIPGKASYKLEFTVDENGSGYDSAVVVVNGKQIENEKLKTTDNKHFTADVELAEETADNDIIVAVSDKAFNTTVEEYTVSSATDPSPVSFENLTSGEAFKDKELVLKGKVADSVDKLYLGVNVDNSTNEGFKEVKLNADKTFEQKLELAEGLNLVSVKALNKNGDILTQYAVKQFCDSTAPVIKLESPTATEDGVLSVKSNDVTLKGTVSDNLTKIDLKINGEKLPTASKDSYGYTEQKFEYSVKVEDGQVLTIEAEDELGNVTIQKYTVKVEPVRVEGITEDAVYNGNVTPFIEFDENVYDGEFTLDGQPFTNGGEVTTEGKHTLVAKLTPKKQSETLQAASSDAKQRTLSVTKQSDGVIIKTVNFTIDKTAPDVEVYGVEDGKLYNTDVNIKALVESDATLTAFTLDGKEFDGKAVTAEGKHTVTVEATDKAGNVTTKTVNFTIDKTAPVITVEGVKGNVTYDRAVSAKVNVNEETSELTVTLDGKEYKGEEISSTGKHVLKVTAVDLAGNKSEQTIEFTVDIKKNDTTPANKGKGSGKQNPGLPVTKDDNVAKKDQTKNSTTTKTNSTAQKGTTAKGTSTKKASSMPKTGSVVNTASLMVTGILLISAGAGVYLFSRKRRRN